MWQACSTQAKSTFYKKNIYYEELVPRSYIFHGAIQTRESLLREGDFHLGVRSWGGHPNKSTPIRGRFEVG